MDATLVFRISRMDSDAPAALCEFSFSSDTRDFKLDSEVRVEDQQSLEFHLPSQQSWNVDADCEGYWADSVQLAPESPTATLKLLPVGMLKFVLHLAEGREVPDSIGLRFRIPDSDEPETLAVLESQNSFSLCSRSNTQHVECLVPSGVHLDGRIEAPGYSSFYFWNLEIPARSEADLGPLVLAPGSSLVGWVDASAHPEGLDSGSTVKLSPANLSGWVSDPAAKKRSGIRSYRTQTDSRGFFQLVDLAPGSYRLQAAADGLSDAGVDLQLMAAEEMILDPLALQPLSRFEAFVTPPTYADGTPWILSISRPVPGQHQPPPVVAEEASLDGSFSYEGLPVGTYLVQLEDTYGSTWWQQEASVEWPSWPTLIDLDLVRVRGRLSFGGQEPAIGEIFIGTKSRRPNFRMVTDEDGEFEGFVSQEGTWAVDISLTSGVRIRTEPVNISTVGGTGTATVDIELPDTRLEGTVRFRGEAATHAFVVVFGQENSRRELLASRAVDEDGNFEIVGAQPGVLLLRAYNEEASSEWIEVDLAEARRGPRIDIELAETRRLTGMVVTENGPVGGAILLPAAVLPGRTRSLEMNRVVSAVDGSFELAVDSRASALDVAMFVPGCGIELLRWDLPEDSTDQTRVASCAQPRGELVFSGESVDRATLSLGSVDVAVRKLLTVLASLGATLGDDRGIVIDGLRAGNYRLCDPSGRCSRGVLAGRDVLELSLKNQPELEDTDQ